MELKKYREKCHFLFLSCFFVPFDISTIYKTLSYIHHTPLTNPLGGELFQNSVKKHRKFAPFRAIGAAHRTTSSLPVYCVLMTNNGRCAADKSRVVLRGKMYFVSSQFLISQIPHQPRRTQHITFQQLTTFTSLRLALKE